MLRNCNDLLLPVILAVGLGGILGALLRISDTLTSIQATIGMMP